MKKFLLFLFFTINFFFFLHDVSYAQKPNLWESLNYDTVCDSRGGTCQLGCGGGTYDDSSNQVCHPALKCCTTKRQNSESCSSPQQCSSGYCRQGICATFGENSSPTTPPTQPTPQQQTQSDCARIGGWGWELGKNAYCIALHGTSSRCFNTVNDETLADGCYTPSGSSPSPQPTTIPSINTSICIQVSEETRSDPCPSWHDKNYYCAGPGAGTEDGCAKLPPSGEKPTADPQPTRASSGGGGGGGGSQPAQASCPAEGDNCWYNEGNKCYSGRTNGEGGVNVDGCVYSCGPVDNDKCKISSKEKKSKNKKTIECTPGEPVNDCSTKCKNGGTCKEAHTFCEWTEDGNVESKCVCDDEDSFCSSDEEKRSGGGSCQDNPTSPPDGYTWKNSCKSCGSNDDCPRNTGDGAVNAETSNWCFGGSCLMLTSGGSSSKESKESDKKSSSKKEDDKAKKEKEKKKKETEKKKKEKEKKKQAEKTAAEKEKQANKKGVSGEPTSTPAASLTPTPTPLPPLVEPTNWQGFCGQTTDPTRPWGIRVSWDPVAGASRYAVRIDEDAPSWEGDTPGPGDTVDNQVANTAYVRVAKPGAVYQWWVHSVNASGVYSGLTKKLIIKCPEENPKTGTISAQAVGAGQLIVLPQKK